MKLELQPEFDPPPVMKAEPEPKKQKPKAAGRDVRRPDAAGGADDPHARHPRTAPTKSPCGHWAQYKTTASGRSVYTNAMRLVAADTRVLPFNSIISVAGVSQRAAGAGARPRRGDQGEAAGRALPPPTPRRRSGGAQWLTITVWEYVDRK